MMDTDCINTRNGKLVWLLNLFRQGTIIANICKKFHTCNFKAIKQVLYNLLLDISCPIEKGGCADDKCQINLSEVIQLDNDDHGNTLVRQKQCLDLCKSIDGAVGCELVWGPGQKGCFAYKQPVAQVKRSCLNGETEGCSCWIFSNCKQDMTGMP